MWTMAMEPTGIMLFFNFLNLYGVALMFAEYNISKFEITIV